MPIKRLPLLLTAFCLLLTASVAWAQSSTATLSGTIEDENGAVIPGARITVTYDATAQIRHATTNDSGSFSIPLLPPGEYTVLVEREGFTRVQLTNIVLNVGDQKAVQVQLKVGDVASTVEVRPDANLIDTEGSVGTVVDRQFVEDIPLNGRSFQSLLELTPGVVIAPAGTSQQGGQFSVNGQRTGSNYFTVDGVSANTGISGSSLIGQSGSGQLPALTASGTTSSLVSVDALQEFRIQTSSYSPEFGRQPGGQVSIVTRSGTNKFQGSVFEYFRHDSLDANDWFVNANRLPNARLRQHQFGGTFSGPIFFPNFGDGGSNWYNGRNRTFFFFSFEALRLLEPRAQVVNVATVAVRQAAVSAAQPYVNALPIPNGRDLGNGTAEFAASYSDSSRFNASGLRVDHQVGDRLTFFGRFSHTPSFSRVRTNSLSTIQTTNQNNTSFTAGVTWLLSNKSVNDLRLNYTTTSAPATTKLDEFGGAVVPSPSAIFAQGRNPNNSTFSLTLLDGFVVGGTWRWGTSSDFTQRQFNIVDSLTINKGSHALKLGIDFRRISPLLKPGPASGFGGSENLRFSFSSLALGRATRYDNTIADNDRRSAAFDNLSLYVQDNWKVNKRLSLTYGLRWELVPPPRATEGGDPVTLDNLDNPFGGQVVMAPNGTSLWETRYNNFAPRIGASYLISDEPGSELVIRGGVGIFHDLGYGQIADAFALTYPFIATRSVTNVDFPLSTASQLPPVLGIDPPLQLFVMDRELVLPRSYQWNVSVERSLGPRQTLTATFVGSEGRKLLKLENYRIRLVNWPSVLTPILVNRNLGHSDYRALQLQFQRRLNHGLQALASYTFGRSRDTSSDSVSSLSAPAERIPIEADYGYSDYDVRHIFTAAVTYQFSNLKGEGFWKAAARNWGIDLMLRARSGFPINVLTSVSFPPEILATRPNLVPEQPFWIEDPNAPGGRRLNRQAFAIPPANTSGDLPRGAVRGFGARQVDFALRREFVFKEHIRLQLRGELFNLFNWPNFTNPSGTLSTSSSFGLANLMLNRGLGGLSQLYQIGGPRSAQLAAKVTF